MTPDDPDIDGRDDDRPLSKSAIKRELAAVRALARDLVDLSPVLRNRLPMSDDTREALDSATKMKNRARQRQLAYAGALLAREDVAAIEATLLQLQRPQREQVRAMHHCERWRDALVDGDMSVLDELAGRFAQLDRQQLRRLAKQAQHERDRGQAPAAARRLFRYLSELENAD